MTHQYPEYRELIAIAEWWGGCCIGNRYLPEHLRKIVWARWMGFPLERLRDLAGDLINDSQFPRYIEPSKKFLSNIEGL